MYVGGSQSVRHRDKHAEILFCMFADTSLFYQLSQWAAKFMGWEQIFCKISINVIGAKKMYSPLYNTSLFDSFSR